MFFFLISFCNLYDISKLSYVSTHVVSTSQPLIGDKKTEPRYPHFRDYYPQLLSRLSWTGGMFIVVCGTS